MRRPRRPAADTADRARLVRLRIPPHAHGRRPRKVRRLVRDAAQRGRRRRWVAPAPRVATLTRADGWWSVVFAVIFFSVLGMIVYSAWKSATDPNAPRRPPRPAGGRPWFGGGGGDDPPPPYYPRPPRYKPSSTAPPDWTPGFFSGAAAGAAGAYMLANRNRDREQRPAQTRSSFGGGGSNFAESSSSAGAQTHESSGFGQTRRR